MKYLMLLVIRSYQKTLSPDHGFIKHYFPHGFCRFHPSCSEYALQAIEKHGAAKGIWLAIKRVGRCNPLSEPAIDQVPQ